MIYGGTVTLQDAGALTGTPGIGVNDAHAGHQRQRPGRHRQPHRTAPPITLNGGILTYAGRAQTARPEPRARTLAQGESVHDFHGGRHGRQLRRPGACQPDACQRRHHQLQHGGRPNGASGLIGTQRPRADHRPERHDLTNNIIGPWAIDLRDFASYVPGLGVGALNAAGFPGYSNTSLITGTWLPTDNVKLTIATATTVPMAASTTINTLNVAYSANATLDLGGNTLTLGSGTLSGGLMFDTGTDATRRHLAERLRDGRQHDLPGRPLPVFPALRAAPPGRDHYRRDRQQHGRRTRPPGL